MTFPIFIDPHGRAWKIYFINGEMCKEPIDHLVDCSFHRDESCDCYDRRRAQV